MDYSPVRYFSADEMRALADKMQERAQRNCIIHLTPTSAWLCGEALRMYAARPTRDDLVTAVCGSKRCPLYPCYACVGKANAIVHIFEGIKSLV
jgi:hypothetical protein